MDSVYLSKEQIALELTLASMEKCFPNTLNADSENIGKAIAALYNTILDNLKD